MSFQLNLSHRRINGSYEGSENCSSFTAEGMKSVIHLSSVTVTSSTMSHLLFITVVAFLLWMVMCYVYLRKLQTHRQSIVDAYLRMEHTRRVLLQISLYLRCDRCPSNRRLKRRTVIQRVTRNTRLRAA